MRRAVSTLVILCTTWSAMAWDVQVWRGDPQGLLVYPDRREITIRVPGDYGLRAVENGAPADINTIVADAGGPVSLDVAWDAAGSYFGASRIGSINETAASPLTIKRCAIETTLGHAGSSTVSTVEGQLYIGTEIVDGLKIRLLTGNAVIDALKLYSELTIEEVDGTSAAIVLEEVSGMLTVESGRSDALLGVEINSVPGTLECHANVLSLRINDIAGECTLEAAHEVRMGVVSGDVAAAEWFEASIITTTPSSNVSIGRVTTTLQLGRSEEGGHAGRLFIDQLDGEVYCSQQTPLFGTVTVGELQGYIRVPAADVHGAMSVEGSMWGHIEIGSLDKPRHLCSPIHINGAFRSAILRVYGALRGAASIAIDGGFGTPFDTGSVIKVDGGFDGPANFVTIDYDGYHAADRWLAAIPNQVKLGDIAYFGNAPAARVYEVTPCKGDMDNDGDVDAFDVDMWINFSPGAYCGSLPGLCGSYTFHADFTEDGLVNDDDFKYMFNRVGVCSPEPFDGGDSLQGGGELMMMAGGGSPTLARSQALADIVLYQLSPDAQAEAIAHIAALAANPPANSTANWPEIYGLISGS